jgi:hypothetical protein
MPSIPFPEPTARRDGPMGWAEPRVNFYLKSTRPVASVGRATINDWYSHFPDSNGAFLGRMRSAEDADHEGALDELFVHERLIRNVKVCYEEGGKGPDFRLYRGSEYLAGVEVLSLFMRKDWSDEQARHDRLADELNKRVSPDRWGLNFEIIRLDRTPSARRLATWVRRTVDALPPHDPTQPHPFTPPRATYAADGVHLEFEFHPRKVVKPGDRIVGGGPAIGGWINSAERLRVALAGKAGRRYDIRERPFALCVSARDSFCSLDQIEDALYGDEQVAVPLLVTTRAGNGFFGRTPGYPLGKNRRISCVFVVENWSPWSPQDAVVLRLDNPFAERAFPDDLLAANFCFTEVNPDNNGITFDWLPGRPSR